MPKGEKTEDFVPIGKVVGVHGIRGDIKLLYFSHLKAFPYPDLYFSKTDGSFHRYKITLQKPLKGTLAIRLEKVTTRSEAQRLIGKLVYYPRKDFSPLNKDEYYWVDLIGMTVVEPTSPVDGKIKGMLETGGTDVMEIAFEEREILIPFSFHWISDISLEEKRLTLKEGTLEYFDVD